MVEMLKSFITLLAGPILLAVAIALVYGRATNAPFIFDDSESVQKNSSIIRLWPLVGDSQHPGPLNPIGDLPVSGRPLANLSLALNFYFGQLQPSGYHIVNLILHWLNAVLLAAILARTMRLDYYAGAFNAVAQSLALAVALIWAVHPLQTEAVEYVTQRTELLMGFFYLLTLYCSMRYWSAITSTGQKLWLACAVLACLAGVACKEVMATAPVAILLFERTFIAGSFRSALRRSWPLYVGLILSWILFVYLNIDGPRSDTAGFHLGVSASQWWFTQAKVLVLYLKLAVWPSPLSIHYAIPYLTWSQAWPYVLFDVCLLLGVGFLFWRRILIGYLGALFFLILSPTLVIPIVTEVAAERRMYLPLAAVMTLIIVGTYTALQRLIPAIHVSTKSWPATAALLSIALVLAVALGTVSVMRLESFKDELTLWQETVANQPDDYLALTGMGLALANAGRNQEAIDAYNRSLKVEPRYSKTLNNLGVILGEQGRHQDAIQFLQEAVRLKPNYAEAHNNFAIELAQTGRELEAIDQFKESLRCSPDNPSAYANLAMVYSQLNRPDDALAAAESALDHGRRMGRTDFVRKFESWLKDYHKVLSDNSGATSKLPPPPPP